MPFEIKGTRLRYRVKRPIKGAIFLTHDIGAKGHTQRIAMLSPKAERWSTQAWTFPLTDIRKKRPATMKVLSKLGIKRKALKKVI